jgi:hypothetical protein
LICAFIPVSLVSGIFFLTMMAFVFLSGQVARITIQAWPVLKAAAATAFKPNG